MEIDVSGLVCPQPTLVVRRCLAELDPGQELLVTGDYPPAQRSIRRTCYKHDFEIADETQPDSDGEFTLHIRVTEAASLSDSPAESEA